jgi:hypothetical protein
MTTFIRCQGINSIAFHRSMFGENGLDILLERIRRKLELAGRLDRREITAAQFDAESTRITNESISAINARSAAEISNLDAQLRALRSAPVPAPAPTPTQRPITPPTAVDCSVTPGSLGRSVSCW